MAKVRTMTEEIADCKVRHHYNSKGRWETAEIQLGGTWYTLDARGRAYVAEAVYTFLNDRAVR